MVNALLLQQRKHTKAKKPLFLRQDAHRNKSLEKRWRKPKGMHSKMRLHLRGRRSSPSPGYASPHAVKGLTRFGFKEVYVQNVRSLEGFDPKTQIIVLGKLGLRKKMVLLKICVEKNYPVAQIKDIQAFMQKIEAGIASRKNKKQQEKKKDVAIEKTKDKKEAEKKEDTEETKKGEKSDKIKILEKKQ